MTDNKKTNQPFLAMDGTPPTPPGLQKDLFEITDGTSNPELRVYSNISEVWDLLPKYDTSGSNKRYHADLPMDQRVRKIPVRHKLHREQFISDHETFVDLELQITPALIDVRRRVWKHVLDKNGKPTQKRQRVYERDENGDYITEKAYVFPSLREDKVEDVLRWLSTHGQGDFKQEITGVTFSVKQIQKELKRTGSTMSADEIKESLLVLSKSRCDIYGLDADGHKRSVMNSSFMPNLMMVTRDDYQARIASGERSTAFCYAQFHISVTMSIRAMRFRLTHYIKHQRLDNLLARHIHKVLRTSYINAGVNTRPFRLSHNQLMAEVGRIDQRQDVNVKVTKTALSELIKEKILESYEVELEKRLQDKRGVSDRIYWLTPSSEFIDEMIASNAQNKQNTELMDDYVSVSEIGKQVTELDSTLRLTHKELRAWGLSSRRALEIVKQYPPALLRRILREVKSGQYNGKIKNPSGFIIKALDEGWFADASYIPQNSEAPFEESEARDYLTLDHQPDITYNGLNEINPEPQTLRKLPEPIQEMVLDEWPQWDKAMRRTFNSHGLQSPAICEALKLPI